ncbi:MAG: LptF/LptG family permease [Lentisphaeria bacterium]
MSKPMQSKYSEPLARYLLWRFILPLVCCHLGFAVLFMVMDAFDVLKDFLDSHAQLSDMVGFFIAKQPQRLSIVSPMAFLLSAMFCFATLSRNNEITALRASGISLVRSCRYIWISTVIAIVGLNYTLDTLSPEMFARAEFLENRINNPDLDIQERMQVAYRSKETNRDWIFGDFPLKGEKKSVMVTQFRADQTLDWELRADGALYIDSAGYWLFKKGQISYFDKDGALPLRAPEYFESRTMEQVTESPNIIRNSLTKLDLLSTSDIKFLLKNNRGMVADMVAACKSNIYYRKFFPVACLIALMLAIPLSINSGRGGIYANLGIAVISMLSYYGVIQCFVVLAKKQYIGPFIGMLLPTMVYLVIGGVLLYKKR